MYSVPRKKKHDLTSVKSKPSEVISDHFRDPKKNDTGTVTVVYSYFVIVVSGYWANCPDTGQHRSSAKILISRWKQRQKS